MCCLWICWYQSFSDGSRQLDGKLSRRRKYPTPESRKASVDNAYLACSIAPPVTLEAMAGYMGVTGRCARDRLMEQRGNYRVKGGFVGRTENGR